MATLNACDVEIINPLHQIEAVFGNIETWPSIIIKLSFIDAYNPKNIFETGALFYGNKIPLYIAFSFYAMCNEHNSFLALIHFKFMYKMWNTHTCCTRTYYDMKLKKKDCKNQWRTIRSRRRNTLSYRWNRASRKLSY